jgi:hypothetical protein
MMGKRSRVLVLALIAIALLSLTAGGCAPGRGVLREVHWKMIPDVAQYKGADWANEVRRERGISLERAKEIGASDQRITYFFYMKGGSMYLEGGSGPHGWTDKGVFNHGDAVFFSGKPWYGSAPGFADAYEKE